MMENNQFQPNWVSSPGDTITDILEERKLSIRDFAQQIGYTYDETYSLLSASMPITLKTAQVLENVLGASTAFWIARESQYREGVAYLQREAQHKENTEWLKELPIKDMINFKWLQSFSSSADKVAACLSFFGVPDVRTWRDKYSSMLGVAAFKTSSSFSSQPGAVAAWLRWGEIESESIHCKPWDAVKFREVLPNIRLLTREKDPKVFIPILKKYCAECGVAVVIARAPKGCRASGATRFLSPNKALLLLSFRYLSDDHFWFAFFHEAGHLLLHNKKSLFLESKEMLSTKEEKEADDFAAHTLIPPEFRKQLLELRANTHDVIRFARLVPVSRGVVVGQLQHFGRIKRNQLNSLKRRYKWVDD